jgi:O-methyltransferase
MRMSSVGPDCAAYDLYLEHLKLSLTGALEPGSLAPLRSTGGILRRAVLDLMRRRGLTVARPHKFDAAKINEGLEWPPNALTMIGFKRLDNIRRCAEEVLRNGVPGDFIEAGVWRGGAAMFMKAILAASEDSARRVWLADSFQGLPPPSPQRNAIDRDHDLGANSFLSVSLGRVRDNFARYGLLDDRVVFVEGWFRDTLPRLSDERLALVRLDGDLYESTMDGLTNLYPNLSPGGFIIVDDYGDPHWGSRQAVDDYRSSHDISEEITKIDWTGVYWQKASS